MERSRPRSQSGFTLVELLVVIAVLGALSGVVVVSVGALRGDASQAACDSDARTISTAQQAAMAELGGFRSEANLVSGGFLSDESTLHDVVLADGDYTLVPVGDCAGDGGEVADGADPPSGLGDEVAAEEPGAEVLSEEEAKRQAEEEAEKAAEQEKAAEAERDAAEKEKAAEQEQAEKEKAAEAERAAAEEKKAAEQATPAEATAEERERRDRCDKGQIDLNSASKKELRELKHVGGDEASRIEKQRPFKSVEQLVEVKGLDESEVKDILAQGLACVA